MNAEKRAPSRPKFSLPKRTKSEAELLAEGWERRFVVAPPRLKEVVELYESLGHEIHLEPLTPEDLREECEECRLALGFFRVVYTRPKVGIGD